MKGLTLPKAETNTGFPPTSSSPVCPEDSGGANRKLQTVLNWHDIVMRNALEGVLLLGNPPGKILEVNNAFCNMLGYSREELLRMSVKDFDIDFSLQEISEREQNIKKSGGVSFTTRHKCKDGKIIDVLINISYIDIGDGLKLCFHRDVTEQKKVTEQLEESENLYQILIELGAEAGEAVVMLQDIDGKEGVQTFVSDQWPRITGYNKEELLGMSFFDLEKCQDRPASLARHRLKMLGKPVPGLFENVNYTQGRHRGTHRAYWGF